MTAETFIKKLQDENNELLDRVEFLESVLFGGFNFPSEWHLSRLELKTLLAIINARGVILPETLNRIVYDDYETKTFGSGVHVRVSRIRKKTGIALKNRRSLGYWIDGDEKAELKKKYGVASG